MVQGLFSIQFFLHDAAGLPGLFHIDDTLVAAAAEGQGQVALLQVEFSIDKDINALQQLGHRRIFHAGKLLESIAGIGPDIQAVCMELFGQLSQRGGLTEGLATAEGDTGKQWIIEDMREQVIRIGGLPAGEVVRLRILAALTMMGAACVKIVKR